MAFVASVVKLLGETCVGFEVDVVSLWQFNHR